MSTEILYIGCYTPEGNAGIKVIEFDNLYGQLTEIKSISVLPDASFLAVSKNKKILLAVSEDEIEGQLACFDIQQPKSPIFINKQPSLGGAPCHISLTENQAFVSNYMSGNLSAFSLSDHQLLPAYTKVQHSGKSVNLERQESAHVHASKLSLDEQFLVVADLGIDEVKVYQICASQLILASSASLPAGAGPRHLTFNASGDKLYLGNELNNQVAVFNFNVKSGELTLIQNISSLPDENTLESYIAEVTLSDDGRYLYVSNRGHDSITTLSVDQESGLLKSIDFTKTGGLFPRHFSLSPNQHWLLVANQNSDYLHVFKRDIDTGLLAKTAQQLAVKHAVCICFLEG